MKKAMFVAMAVFVLCSAALAGPREEAQIVIDRWAKAFTDSDVDTIVGLYAPDALFFGTGSKTLVTQPEGIRKYFEGALLTNRPRGASLGEHSVMVLSDTAVAFTGLDRITGVRNGEPYAVTGRVSFVVAKRNDGWKIVHFHRSAMPQ